MTDTRKKFLGAVDGEPTEVYALEDGQWLALLRCQQAVQAGLSFQAMSETLLLAEDIVMSTVVDEETVTKLRRKLALGQVTLVGLVNEMMKQQADAASEDTPVAAPVRRRPGRPRKSA